MTRAPQRIASLLPGATEVCFALGLGERVVGVSHECDFPAQAAARPALTATTLDSTASSRAIDAQVRERVTNGLSLYNVIEDRLRALAPDLIVTQDTCEVCAIALDDVRDATRRLLGNDVDIVSLAPTCLDDVFDDMERVAVAAGVEEHGRNVVAQARESLDVLARASATEAPVKVLLLEWLDPPMVAGHWTPELLRMAGGQPVLSHPGEPTRATTWEAIAASGAERVILAPCGFKLEQTLRELPAVLDRPGMRELPIAIIDGNAYFNRPGPRLIDSAQLAAVAMHPSPADARGVDRYGTAALRWAHT